jgi:hypothetical protein
MISDLTPEQVLAANVDNKPPAQDPDVEAKIAKAVKGQKFTIELTAAQVEVMNRFASVCNKDWKEYFKQEIESKILRADGFIGAPLIAGPSFASKKIGGPSR